jgi:hypothetical protein
MLSFHRKGKFYPIGLFFLFNISLYFPPATLEQRGQDFACVKQAYILPVADTGNLINLRVITGNK